MGIFGSILGAGLGGLLDGPLGAVLGGVIGHHVSGEGPTGNLFGGGEAGAGNTYGQGGGYARGRPTQGEHAAAELQRAFAVALTSLAAKISKADGQVTQEEIQTFDRFLREGMHLDEDERKLAARVFNSARDSKQPASAFANQIAMLFRRQPERLRDIVVLLLTLAYSDGHLHAREEAMIRDIARRFGLGEQGYESCKAQFEATSHQNDYADPYAILEVSASATDAEVKSAHRKLVREYHPDTLQSKGLPEDFMDFATEKMKAVNAAWARVKQERGL